MDIELLNEDCLVALKKLPNDADVQYHLGMAYQKSLQRAQAIEHLERALQLNPNFPKADEVRQTLAALHRG